MKLGIKNKVAIVTGGATGIGFSIACDLAKEGCNVVISSRNKNSLKKSVSKLRKINRNCDGFQIDVCEKKGPEKLVNKTIKKFKQINILVNNVGDTLNIMNPYCGENEWIKLFKLILGVAIKMNNLVIPIMTKKKWGRIVNITAGASMENSGPVTYSSLKAAFTAYSRSMARVLATENNNVVMSAVLPGLVLTERGHWKKVLKERPEHAEKYLNERTTLKRFGYPNEISPMVTLLCSDLASFCIGTIVPVEGGQARHYFQKVDDF
mgnify:CR=1 FL=1|tara:strand:+ start:108 stop:902 length:795 start_codon:yes stop_codon:yes gene_type:complete